MELDFVIKRIRENFISSRNIPSAEYIINKYECNPLKLSTFLQEILDNHSTEASVEILISYGMVFYKVEFGDETTYTFLHVNTTDYKNIKNIRYEGTSVCVHNTSSVIFSIDCYQQI